MKRWSDWEMIRRKVAVAGRVLDDRNSPVAGALVAITPVPGEAGVQVESAGGRAAEGRKVMEKRLGLTSSRLDGIYFFLDLPAGHYVLTATDPRSGRHDEKSVSVLKDKKDNIKMAQADFKLPARQTREEELWQD